MDYVSALVDQQNCPSAFQLGSQSLADRVQRIRSHQNADGFALSIRYWNGNGDNEFVRRNERSDRPRKCRFPSLRHPLYQSRYENFWPSNAGCGG